MISVLWLLYLLLVSVLLAFFTYAIFFRKVRQESFCLRWVTLHIDRSKISWAESNCLLFPGKTSRFNSSTGQSKISQEGNLTSKTWNFISYFATNIMLETMYTFALIMMNFWSNPLISTCYVWSETAMKINWI